MKNTTNIELLTQEGEGYLVEFKESPSHLEKEICAFANASGGTIYIGISDKGEIKPISLTNKLKSELINCSRNCDPPPQVEIQQFGKIISMHVFESLNKPVKSPNGFYMRIGATSQKLTREEIFSFAISETKIVFDEHLYVNKSADECMNIRAVEVFREKARLEINIENIKLLENIGCIKYQENTPYFTNAGLLLFGEEPQKIFPQSTLTVLHMKDLATILEQRIFRGNLFDEVENAFSFVVSLLKSIPQIIGLQREDKLEIPEFILRELLINSVIHRDYFERSADIMVKVFSNFIEFSNPGTVSKKLPLNSLFGRSYRRNPMIADLFYRANYIERAGTGLLRVKQALEKLNLPPLSIFEDGPFFIVHLHRGTQIAVGKKLNKRQLHVQSLPDDFFPFSTKQYAKKFSISERMARTDIQELISVGLLKSVKSGREVRYDIIAQRV